MPCLSRAAAAHASSPAPGCARRRALPGARQDDAHVDDERGFFRLGSAALCSSSMLSRPARMTARRMSERVASCQGVLRTPLRASTRVSVVLSSLTATWSFDDIVLYRSALGARSEDN